ncbi:hypothetical protein ACFLZJ_00530 [Nanoarchaeota archaeon]
MINVEEILKNNLIRMTNVQLEGNMLTLLQLESWGDNGGTTKDNRTCACANFYMNKDIGTIIRFGNYQNLSKEIINNKNYTPSSFRVALDNKAYTLEIVDYKLPKDLTSISKEILDETVKRFNDKKIMLG